MSEYHPTLTCHAGKHENRPKTRREPRTASGPLPPPRLQHLPREDSHRATTIQTIQTTKQCQSLAGTNDTERLRNHLRAREEGVPVGAAGAREPAGARTCPCARKARNRVFGLCSKGGPARTGRVKDNGPGPLTDRPRQLETRTATFRKRSAGVRAEELAQVGGQELGQRPLTKSAMHRVPNARGTVRRRSTHRLEEPL